MPFIGVRISWLIVARNSLFARSAASAAFRAASISASTRLRGVTSVKNPRHNVPPSGVAVTEAWLEIQHIRPLGSTRRYSNCQ